VFRRRFVLGLALLVGAIAVSAIASVNDRRVVGDCTKSQVRPTTIILACADDNLSLTHLRWKNFGAGTAHASGLYHVNDCTPNCAAGRFHSYPVLIVLSDAKLCEDRHDDYRFAAWAFTAARPPGHSLTGEQLGCPLPG
jgi:hypothetical protein